MATPQTQTCVSACSALLTLLTLTNLAHAQKVGDPRWWLEKARTEIKRFPESVNVTDAALAELKVPFQIRRADVIAALAQSCAKAGDTPGAKTSVADCEMNLKRTPSPEHDPFVHVTLAGVHARLGDVQAANHSIGSAYASFELFAKSNPEKAAGRRSSLANAVIRQFADAAAFDQAISRAEQLESPSGRAYALIQIAESQHKAGRADAGRRTMKAAEAAARQAMTTAAAAADRDYELSCICDGLINIGDLVGAERIASELPPKDRPNKLTTIAFAYHKAKDLDAARRSAAAALASLRSVPAKELTVKWEAPGLARFFTFIGDATSSTQAQDLVKDDKGVAEVEGHYALAMLHAQNGQIAEARHRIDLARTAEAALRRTTLGEVHELLSSMNAWPARIAQAHLNASHPDEALRLADLYKDDEGYATSLRAVLVVAKAASGDVAGVKRDLELIEPGLLTRDFVRSVAIKALVRSADETRLRELATWLDAQPDAYQRIGSYLTVCDALADGVPPSR